MNTANELRSALKSAGLSARSVSVRSSGGSLETTLYVTIRTAMVARREVEIVANRFANVRYCGRTGELLCGGNTFVRVEHASDVLAPVQASILADLEAGRPTVGSVTASPSGWSIWDLDGKGLCPFPVGTLSDAARILARHIMA